MANAWKIGSVQEAGSGERRTRWLRAAVVMTFWLFGRLSFAQTLPPPGPPPYQTLRFEEDYSYLRDPSSGSDMWDPVKFVALNGTATWYLSLGGEVRERYEYFHNTNWGGGPQDGNGYALQRFMAHADLHLGEQVRFFLQ